MCYEGTVVETPPIVPEGTYNAFPVSIKKEESKFKHQRLKIYFKLETEDEFDGEEVSGMCSDNIHENSKWGKWLIAITGKLPKIGDKVKKEDILLKPCLIAIKHTQKDDNTIFANVKNVLPPQQKNTNNGDTPF
ncbi:hypothetical protein ACFL2X_02115 [Candidatus Latescibacterota bacterium]